MKYFDAMFMSLRCGHEEHDLEISAQQFLERKQVTYN